MRGVSSLQERNGRIHLLIGDMKPINKLCRTTPACDKKESEKELRLLKYNCTIRSSLGLKGC